MINLKEEICKKLLDALEDEPVYLTFSSPKIKSARAGIKQNKENDFCYICEENIFSFGTEEDDEKGDNLDAPSSISKRDLKRKKKELKRKEKEEALLKKRDEKAYRKMRDDIRKRGFNTGILLNLNDPSDIYDMSDKEISQLEMASLINADGYYDFEYPKDFESLENKKADKKIIFIFTGFALLFVIVTFIFIRNVFALF